MNERAVLARKKQLVAQTNQIVQDGQELLKVIETAKEKRKGLLEQYKANVARINEIEAWIGGSDDDKQTPADLPKAGSPEAIEKAKEERTTSGKEDWDEEKVLKQREIIYDREAMSHVDTLDDRPDEDETSEASESD